MGIMHFMLFAITFYITQAVPLSVSDNSDMILPKDRRISLRSYPDRTMMFTGYYKPTSRSLDSNPGTNVYAQGNAVSGGTYLGGVESEYLQPGLDKERPVSSAEAEAAPDFEEHKKFLSHSENDDNDDDQKIHSAAPSILNTTESSEEARTTPLPNRKNSPKKKKTPVSVDQDEEEDLDEDDYDDAPAPFIPFKGNKRNRGYLPFNTYFPMIFSFPGVASRSGTSGSVPGTITAVANSYSTAKGGVASSVATAYGGTPTGKKQRQILSENQ